VVINGSASVNFIAGNCINLKPGFRATAGSAATTFHAWTQTLPVPVSVSPASGSGMSRLSITHILCTGDEPNLDIRKS
jgi:hypothetical protein